jgi:thiol-disulfide isomerase/thioredoxin
MRTKLTLLLAVLCSLAQAQPSLKVGDLIPDMVIRNLVNAPVKEVEARMYTNKFTILNFWGTWCAPCLPEMDSLAILQKKNNGRIQVIAISNEPVSRLEKYLQRKPSGLWLASDTSGWLYGQFGLNYVGQSAILDPEHRVIALVRTDSINQQMIDKLARKELVRSSAETGNKTDYEVDPFAVDSTIDFQVTLSGHRPGMPGMSKSYLKTAFEGRRRTYINSCPSNFLMDIFKVSYKQLIYEVPEKSVCHYKDKSTLYCFDLLVKPSQKDSFFIIMRQYLEKLLPVKFRLEQREMPVYVLRRLPDSAPWTASTATTGESSFSGRGFKGTGIVMSTFTDYVANELGLPVVDETGLKGKYDITTENVMRTEEDLKAALKKAGLFVEKTTRLMDAVIIYQ